ncbi:MAG: hypothetical protein LBV04_04700 [Deferribacteraceae bacterium]|jgi:cbb3-type cytochrome oxidase subunit 3|nr:hypothetical protein [Deferribacteraceae bacterium]
MDIEALREMLRGNSAYLIVIVIFLVNIIFGALRKVKLQNKGQNLGQDSEEASAEPTSSVTERNVRRRVASPISGSSNDMFPRGDSLSKTGRSAMFRR